MNVVKIVISLFVLIILGGAGYYGYYQTQIPNNSPDESNYSLTIEEGDGVQGVAKKLKEANIITNNLYFALRSSEFDTSLLQPGEYSLNLPAKPVDLWSQIVEQSDDKYRSALEEIKNKKKTVTLTFKEGLKLDRYIDLIVENGLATEAEVIAAVQEPGVFSLADYPFLPPEKDCDYGDTTTCVKYYLEGYLYPDTYEFFQDDSAVEVITKLLNNFKIKVWDKLELQDRSIFYNTMVVASIVESETGRPFGFADEQDKITFLEEKRKVAQAFYNRSRVGELWRTDPTVVYDHDKPLCQQGRELTDCSFLNQVPLTLYNTYELPGAPIGPISNPAIDSIDAALNPMEGDFLFFVSNEQGKAYFGTTNAEHEANIQQATLDNQQLNN